MSGSYYDSHSPSGSGSGSGSPSGVPNQRGLSNPFKTARLNAKQTKTELANDLGVTIQFIDRIEETLFPTIPERVVEFYSERLNLQKDWAEKYFEFRTWLRRKALRTVNAQIDLDPAAPINFRSFRLKYWPLLSQSEWCKIFRVHPSSVYAMERGGQRKLPDDIAMALVESGVMTRSEVWKLADALKAGGKE